jgi:hypothetical protein
MFLHPRSTLVFPKSSNRSSTGLQAAFPTQAAKFSGEKCRVDPIVAKKGLKIVNKEVKKACGSPWNMV